MQTYRLIIRRYEKLLGHFESGTPWSQEAVQDIAARLGAADGYRLELHVADGERRLVESSPEGTRVLSSEHLFKPAPLKP